MISDNQIAHNHRSGFVDGFGDNAMDAWPVDEFGNSTHEWAYTTSEQNDDDLFLAVPNTSRRPKAQHLQQFKAHWKLVISKLTHLQK